MESVGRRKSAKAADWLTPLVLFADIPFLLLMA